MAISGHVLRLFPLKKALAVTYPRFHLERLRYMVTFAISPEKQRLLSERMNELGVTEKELKESFIRSSGKGGQHVNKTSTCVHLVHLPTGIEVKCMKDRSQSVNRFLARRELLEKIAAWRGLPTVASLEADRIKKRKARARRRSSAKKEEVT